MQTWPVHNRFCVQKPQYPWFPGKEAHMQYFPDHIFLKCDSNAVDKRLNRSSTCRFAQATEIPPNIMPCNSSCYSIWRFTLNYSCFVKKVGERSFSSGLKRTSVVRNVHRFYKGFKDLKSLKNVLQKETVKDNPFGTGRIQEQLCSDYHASH